MMMPWLLLGVLFSAQSQVQIPFDTVRPNPYFQPPDAKKGSRIDVSDVKFIAFAPQDKAAGRLMIDSFVLAK